MNRNQATLLRQLQTLIERHGKDHPELKAELLLLRDQVQASSALTPMQRAASALRIAAWVKWVFDLLPDDLP